MSHRNHGTGVKRQQSEAQMLRLLLLTFLLFSVLFGLATAQAAEAPIPAAYQLTVQDAEAALSKALAEKGAGTQVKAQILGARSPALYESANPLAVEVRTLQFDNAAKRWTANLLVKSGDQVLTAMPAMGRYQEMISLPVLKRQMRSGETLSQGDIEIRDFPYSSLRAEVVTDVAQLVGQSPRTMISPNRPVRGTELSAPLVLKKNAVVQMRYRSGNMTISTTGQALAQGAKGDVIDVRNATSKQIVHAVVEDAANVSVLSPTQQLGQNNGAGNASTF